MLKIKEAFQDLSQDEMNQLLDLPVWIALYAAYHTDGRITPGEKSEAVKLAHMRTYTAPVSLRNLYRLIDLRFSSRFDVLNRRLPTSAHDKLIYIRVQLKNAEIMLNKLDGDTQRSLRSSLYSFYKHIFKADQSFFQYFSLPVISGHIEKQLGRISLAS